MSEAGDKDDKRIEHFVHPDHKEHARFTCNENAEGEEAWPGGVAEDRRTMTQYVTAEDAYDFASEFLGRFDPDVDMLGIGASTDKNGNNQRGNWHKGRAHLMQCGGSKRPMENREGLGRRVRHRSHKLRRGVLRARAPGRDSVL